jgi:hypothetical protein
MPSLRTNATSRSSLTVPTRRLAQVMLAGCLSAAVVVSQIPPAAATVSIDRACPGAEVSPAGFDDTSGITFEFEIDCLAAYAITHGTTPRTYNPSSNVTRGQMALFLARLIRQHLPVEPQPSTPAESPFTDLSPDIQDAVDLLWRLGIVKGIRSDAYGPAQSVTRGQIASFIDHLQTGVDADGNWASTLLEDAFDDDSGSPHESAINALAAHGLVGGVEARAFRPDSQLTRAQMAALLMRLLQLNIDDGRVESVYDRDDPGNTWFNLFNVTTDKCVDVPGFGRGTTNGPVLQHSCDYTSADNQQFRFVEVEDKTLLPGNTNPQPLYLIQNRKDGFCLNLPGALPVPAGTHVIEGECGFAGFENDNQEFAKWEVAPSVFLLRHERSGLCLDVAGDRDRSEDVTLMLWECDRMADDHLWAVIDSSQDEVSRAFVDAYDAGFGPLPEVDRRGELLAPKEADNGLIVARFFIPAPIAAVGILRGDNRGYSTDARALSRFIYTYDLAAGRASLTVAHSERPDGQVGAALPVNERQRLEDVVQSRDRAKFTNTIYNGGHARDPQAPVELEISGINSFTNDHGWAAWSSDGTLKIRRGAADRYMVEWIGNGYPQLEVNYYPRQAEDVRILARRDISPAPFMSTFWGALDVSGSGGGAAKDGASWAECRLASERSMTCTETGQMRDVAPEWTTHW